MRLNIQTQNQVSTFKARIKIAPPDKRKLAKLGLLSLGTASAIAGNAAATASYMDQSVHYPILNSEDLPAGYLHSAEQFPLQQSAYDTLYRPYRLGNETALIPATLTSTGANSLCSASISISKSIEG